MEKIVDINRNDIPVKTVFHFANNSDPFILSSLDNTFIFVNLKDGVSCEWDEVSRSYYGLEFYTKEDDDDFQGVAIIGEITY